MGRGGRGRGGGGKREFDRHSGSERSGVKPVEKRDGSGSYNWGSAKDQIDENVNNEASPNADLDSSAEDKEKVSQPIRIFAVMSEFVYVQSCLRKFLLFCDRSIQQSFIASFLYKIRV
jgi:hypothetical protein